MPVFTSIGVALGVAGGTAAFATGVAAAAVVGAGIHAAGVSKGAAKASQAPGIDPRISEPAGDISEAEAQTVAKKRAFRSGILFTSPTGLDRESSVAGAKLV